MDLRQAQRQLTTDLTPQYGSRGAALIADWVMEHLSGQQEDRPADKIGEPSAIPSSGNTTSIEASCSRTARSDTSSITKAGSPGCDSTSTRTSSSPGPRPKNSSSPGPSKPSAPQIAPPSPEPQPPARSPNPHRRPTRRRHRKRLYPHHHRPQYPTLPIHACDISTGALHIAHRNADHFGAHITFHQLDFLDRQTWVIPPANSLAESGRESHLYSARRSAPPSRLMCRGQKPAQALFVPDSDPLVFYHALAEFAHRQMEPGGAVFVEIHEDSRDAVMEIFRSAGTAGIEARKDLMGKDRMIKATW